MKYSVEQQQALGLDGSQLCEWMQGQKRFFIHKTIVDPLTSLQEAARQSGFDLQIVSAHRDFSRQLTIWNAKAAGERVLLDSRGEILRFDQLSDEEKLFAIMRWSAVPGLSRHHWGTDIDIYDASAMNFDDVRLVPQEVETGGPCAELHEWLTERISSDRSFGFYRPYHHDSGGVAPELWHLSYLPSAKHYLSQLNQDALLALWAEKELLLIDVLRVKLTELWSKYVELELDFQPDWVVKMLSC